jgi:sugar phosphate isomerase/epimerase
VRIGCRAHDFGRRPAEELAAVIAACGFTCVQLAPAKALPGVEWRKGALTPEVAARAASAFHARGIEIAVLGCYVNPVHPDPAMRRELLSLFKEHLQAARDFGCGLVALETGSVNADYSPNPANRGEAAFEEAVRSFAELAEAAERAGVAVGVEAVSSHIVSTPAKLRRLFDRVGSPRLRAVFDPVNLLDAENWARQAEVYREALALFGDRIAVLHLKDFVMEGGVPRPVALGRGGGVDLAPLLAWVRTRSPACRALLEEIDASTAEASALALRRTVDAGPNDR